ncbi:MAG: SDR family oxidoreductase [Cohaesibacteraceae bacterium]|nr:SDR family oxidoreductase [Cohaesibacteraceae bacterium]
MTSLENYTGLADLAGKTVLITGGASGIGAALVEGFVSAKAKVAFLDIDVSAANGLCSRIQKSHGEKPLFIECDITNVAALQTSITMIAERMGPISVLINNAALDTRHSLAELTPDAWDQSLNVNLRPQFFAMQTVAPMMATLGEGSIINVSSNSCMLGLEGYPAYVAAKAAIIGMSKALARELGPKNIRVNTLVPGWVMTDRQKKMWVTDDALAECIGTQSLKEAITPDDMVGPCLFLASRMGRMMTGQTMVIDGGRV